MARTRNMQTTDQAGSDCGTAFDDSSNIHNINEAVITKIVIGHEYYVHSLTVHYDQGSAERHGSPNYSLTEVILARGEYITSIKATWVGGAISDFCLGTNLSRQWGPYGTRSLGSRQDIFDWQAPAGIGLLYFSGLADSVYIRSLRATWAKFRGHSESSRVVKYEEGSPKERSPGSRALLSTFARNLMSPIVTLVVGPHSVKFHAAEDILCRLPFFHAALHGRFKEAADKAIQMPEDEPDIVSALVEFLYNGSYTYTYDPETIIQGSLDDASAPVGDLAEGSFHVHVYAIAHKYDCEPLVNEAVKSFIHVLNELKSIEVIKLWKCAYANGLLLSQWEKDEELGEFNIGLAELLKGLYGTHREEMESMVTEFPALGSDLMRLAFTS